jgi:hypothetical protein
LEPSTASLEADIKFLNLCVPDTSRELPRRTDDRTEAVFPTINAPRLLTLSENETVEAVESELPKYPEEFTEIDIPPVMSAETVIGPFPVKLDAIEKAFPTNPFPDIDRSFPLDIPLAKDIAGDIIPRLPLQDKHPFNRASFPTETENPKTEDFVTEQLHPILMSPEQETIPPKLVEPNTLCEDPMQTESLFKLNLLEAIKGPATEVVLPHLVSFLTDILLPIRTADRTEIPLFINAPSATLRIPWLVSKSLHRSAPIILTLP